MYDILEAGIVTANSIQNQYSSSRGAIEHPNLGFEEVGLFTCPGTSDATG